MSKKIKENRYKPEGGKNQDQGSDSGLNIDFFLKCIMTIAFISALSLASIFAHDFVTQSDFFNIKKIEIFGTKRVLKNEIIELADLGHDKNIFGINIYSTEKLITSHPWIQSASVKRNLSVLFISVIEQQPLAIVKIENLADILINTQGRPFKEYNPQKDHIENLPIISGLDLTSKNNEYMFQSPLLNIIMDFFKTEGSINATQIKVDENTGIAIATRDIYNHGPALDQETIQIKLGFNNFKAKLNKAKVISDYIDKNFPEKKICAMDLFNIEKVFIKTKLNTALHDNLQKGV